MVGGFSSPRSTPWRLSILPLEECIHICSNLALMFHSQSLQCVCKALFFFPFIFISWRLITCFYLHIIYDETEVLEGSVACLKASLLRTERQFRSGNHVQVQLALE